MIKDLALWSRHLEMVLLSRHLDYPICLRSLNPYYLLDLCLSGRMLFGLVKSDQIDHPHAIQLYRGAHQGSECSLEILISFS